MIQQDQQSSSNSAAEPVYDFVVGVVEDAGVKFSEDGREAWRTVWFDACARYVSAADWQSQFSLEQQYFAPKLKKIAVSMIGVAENRGSECVRPEDVYTGMRLIPTVWNSPYCPFPAELERIAPRFAAAV